MPTCATCGQQISLSIGECLYCPAPAPRAAATAAGPAPAAAPAAPAVAAPAPAPPPAPLDPDALHLQAEEALRIGEVERALVLASKVVKLSPQHIAARALYERARREVVRGLRRERLEARVQEAERMMGVGDFAGAERIVTSALKLLPDHRVALDLFGKLKARRLAGSNAAAEAERELYRFSARQARQAVAAAHNALANGWERRALLAVRRGLRGAPDDAELLAMLRELQGAEGDQDPQRARRRALHSQVRAAIDLLRQRKLDGSLAMLRAVLREDPDNVRAQEAVQQVRRAWLRRTMPPVPAVAAAAAAAVALPAIAPRVEAPVVPSEVARPAPAAPPRVAPTPPAAPAAPPRAGPSAPPAPLAPAAARTSPVAAAPPPSVAARAPLMPRPASPEDTAPITTRVVRAPFHPVPEPVAAARRSPPAGAVVLLAGGTAIAVVAAVVLTREPASTPRPEVPPSTATVAAPDTRPAPPDPPLTEPPGPLTDLEPELRQTVEQTLAAYGAALEAQDEAALAKARPDLSARQRTTLLAPFKGALNVAIDLRVVDASARREDAVVTVLRTDVIVDGRGGARPPVEETLRFARRAGSWTLGAAPR